MRALSGAPVKTTRRCAVRALMPFAQAVALPVMIAFKNRLDFYLHLGSLAADKLLFGIQFPSARTPTACSYTRCAASELGPPAPPPLPGDDEPHPALPEPTGTLTAAGAGKVRICRPDSNADVLVTHGSFPTTANPSTATPGTSTSTNLPAESTVTNGEAPRPHRALPFKRPSTITATRTAPAAATKNSNSSTTTAVDPQAAAAATTPAAVPDAAQGLGRTGLLREFALLSLVLTANNCGMIGLPIMDATFGAMGRRMALLTGACVGRCIGVSVGRWVAELLGRFCTLPTCCRYGLPPQLYERNVPWG